MHGFHISKLTQVASGPWPQLSFKRKVSLYELGSPDGLQLQKSIKILLTVVPQVLGFLIEAAHENAQRQLTTFLSRYT
jgi:hypothetical protein